jgi:hypothetical protein
MAAPIFTLLEGRIPIARHEHVAILYRGHDAAFRLAPFLAEGLERGDLAHYLAPLSFHAEMLDRLGLKDTQIERHIRNGILRLQEGLPDFRELRDWTQQVFLDADRYRAHGVRWVEEGLWPGPVGFPLPKFFEFHALLNVQVKHYPSVALCQYALDQIEPHELFGAIAVHRHLLVEDILIRDNPFYIPAERFIPLRPEERERDLMSVFREVGFDVDKLLSALVGFGRLQQNPSRS